MGRYNRKQGGSGGKAFALLFLVVLAIAVGAGVAYREKIFEYLEGEQRKPDLGTPEVTTPARVEPERRVAPPPIPEREPERTEPARAAAGDEAAARARLDAAFRAYNDLEFSKAYRTAEQAAQYAKGTPLEREAARLVRRADLFHKLLKDVEPNPEATGELWVFRMRNSQMVAVKRGEDASNYHVILDGGISAPISKESVVDAFPMPEKERRERYRQGLAEEKAKHASEGGVGLYLTAVYAYRNMLHDEVLPLLEAADEESPNLLREVSDNYASVLLRQAMWYDAIGRSIMAGKKLEELQKEYPDSRYVKDAETLLADIRGRKERVLTFAVEEKKARPSVPERSDTPRTGTTSHSEAIVPSPRGDETEEVSLKNIQKIRADNPQVQRMVEEADKYFEEGMQYYLAGRPGNPNANQKLEKAAECFEKAANTYQKAADADPGNSKLESRASEAARLHYNSIKMQTLGL